MTGFWKVLCNGRSRENPIGFLYKTRQKLRSRYADATLFIACYAMFAVTWGNYLQQRYQSLWWSNTVAACLAFDTACKAHWWGVWSEVGKKNTVFPMIVLCLWTALLERCKHRIDLFTCTLGISACEKAAEWQQALILFEDIRVLRFEPNIVSYGAMLLGPESESKYRKRQV